MKIYVTIAVVVVVLLIVSKGFKTKLCLVDCRWYLQKARLPKKDKADVEFFFMVYSVVQNSCRIWKNNYFIVSTCFFVFSETEMKSKIEELEETVSDLRKTISSLEERIVKEESDKLVRLPASFVIEYSYSFQQVLQFHPCFSKTIIN